MRRFRAPALLAIAVGLLLPASAVLAGDAPLTVGAGITARKSVKIADLSKRPDRYVGQTVRIEGTVKAVCQGRGCWVEVQDAKGASFMAKSLDHSVLLPKDCAGRKIVVQGVVTRQAAEGHEHEPAAGEATEGMAAGHTCPAPEYLVATTGAQLK